LDENGMNSISTITYQIMNGKNGMPAFGGRLTEVEIDEIAKYVLEASEKNFQN
jgi:cytochrome c6